MGRLIDEYKDIKTQQECVSKTIDTLWKMAQKYQQLQADYETRLKADMVAMLEELDFRLSNYQDTDLIRQDIQEKINALKAESEVGE